MAEGAVEGTAHLAGDAQRARLADIRDIDALTLDAGAETGQPFLGAVAADLVVSDFRAGQQIALGQFRTQFLRHIGHRGEILHAEMMDPAAQLLGAHAGFPRVDAKGLHLCFQRRQAQPGQRGRGGGCRLSAAGQVQFDLHQPRPISWERPWRKCLPHFNMSYV